MPLTRRQGPRPTTTPTNPHTQLDQQPTDSKQRDLLAASIFAGGGSRLRISTQSAGPTGSELRRLDPQGWLLEADPVEAAVAALLARAELPQALGPSRPSAGFQD
ncbi:MAG TPA: hypothetical protein VK988_22385 [Acidimicrobiales bacterium]|nr:hypothetical protein [Acidimicrobiales bacterium]